MRILGAWLLIVLIGSCTKPKDLEYIDIQNVKVLKWGFSETLIGLDARFFNPNRQRVRLKDAEAAVYVNSTYLGNTIMDTTIQVPSKDTFSIPLVVKVQTVSTISKVLQSLSDSAVAIRVEGSVKMGKAGVFMTYPIKYQGIQKLKVL